MYHGYILTCSILPEYRNMKNYNILIDSFLIQLEEYAENVFAVGDGLTEEMLFECQRLSKKYGIEILCERKDKNGCNIGNN